MRDELLNLLKHLNMCQQMRQNMSKHVKLCQNMYKTPLKAQKFYKADFSNERAESQKIIHSLLLYHHNISSSETLNISNY